MRIILGLIVTCAIVFAGYGMVISSMPMLTIGAYISAALLGIAAWMSLNAQGRRVFIVLGLFAMLIESVGVATGFPYGEFTHAIPGKIFGLVPLIVFFSWPPLVLLARRVAGAFVPALLLLITFDLLLDPGAVGIGMWSWSNPGMYYGVPIVNFAGWLLSGSIGLLILGQKKIYKHDWLTIITALSLLIWIPVNLFLGQWIPALIGLILALPIYKQIWK